MLLVISNKLFPDSSTVMSSPLLCGLVTNELVRSTTSEWCRCLSSRLVCWGAASAPTTTTNCEEIKYIKVEMGKAWTYSYSCRHSEK